MKVQLESIEVFEEIFKELQGTDEHKHAQDELDLLLHIKNLFLKNVEIGGEELDLGRVTQERIDNKRMHGKVITQIEEAEISKITELKELARIRKDIPEQLKREITKEYQILAKQLTSPGKGLPPVEPPQGLEDLQKIKQTIEELTGKLPVLTSQIKETLQHTEKEVKERTEEKGRQVEAESLALLFKDEFSGV